MKTLSAVYGLTLLLLACSLPAQAAGAVSGSDLYRAIIFHDGPAVALLTGVVGTHPVPTAPIELQKKTIAAILGSEHGFFGSFASSMTSGQPERVRAALNRAADLTIEVLQGPHSRKKRVYASGLGGFTYELSFRGAGERAGSPLTSPTALAVDDTLRSDRVVLALTQKLAAAAQPAEPLHTARLAERGGQAL